MGRPEAWDAYEQAVMEGRGDDVEPPSDDYEMSEAFKQWVVDRMRDEVMGQISGAGLDRMAIVKAGEDEEPAEVADDSGSTEEG